MTLIVPARGHRRQPLTIIKTLNIYLDETNKYINLGLMISFTKLIKDHTLLFIKFYQYHCNL